MSFFKFHFPDTFKKYLFIYLGITKTLTCSGLGIKKKNWPITPGSSRSVVA